MKKETVSIDCIRTDVKQAIRQAYNHLLGVTLLFLMTTALFITICMLDAVHIIVIFYRVFCGFLLILTAALMVRQICKAVVLHRTLKTTDCIVKDRLVGLEEKEHRRRRHIYTTYHLYFASYGEYVIPNNNYTWSQELSLSDQGVYRLSECGDEFFLVLSKQHTGSILLAYNTKLFTVNIKRKVGEGPC